MRYKYYCESPQNENTKRGHWWKTKLFEYKHARHLFVDECHYT